MLTGGDSQSLKSTTPSSNEMQSRLEKMLSFEWLGQTLASFCWIVSVFVYGYASGDGLQLSTGDWLQLAAASSWFIANMASLAND